MARSDFLTLRQLTDALTFRDKILQEKTRRLEEREAMFKTIFYMAPTPMAITRSDTGTFAQVNDSFAKATCYEEKELIGQQTTLLYPHDDREYIYSSVKENGTATVTTFCKRKDGVLLEVVMSVTALTMNDLGIMLTMAHKYEPTCGEKK